MLIKAMQGQAVSMGRLLLNTSIHPVSLGYFAEYAKVVVEAEGRINILHLGSLVETVRAAAAIDPDQLNPAHAAGLAAFVGDHKV